MKKRTFIIAIIAFSFLACTTAQAQFKVHSNGQVSFQSSTTTGGVQIYSDGKSSFEPNTTVSSTPLVQAIVYSPLVKAWNVRWHDDQLEPVDRFYVTGNGEAYARGYYTISSIGSGGGSGGGGNEKDLTVGSYPIENASRLLSSLNGYYYDNHDFEGFEPDFIDNPNIAPEAVEGMLKDLAVDKKLGLSSEDLEAVLPEAIRHDPEGMVYINYSAVIPVLVEAFKEQQARIEQLEAVLKENGLLEH